MKFAIATLLLISFALPAHAQGTPNISPDQCAKLAEQIANRIGGAMESRAALGIEFSLNVKNASELRIICSPASQKQPSIFIKSNSTYPHAAFYKLLADAGHALTGISLRRLNKGAHNCHRASVGTVDGHSNKGVRGLSFECYTSGKDSFSTFLFHRKPEHRP